MRRIFGYIWHFHGEHQRVCNSPIHYYLQVDLNYRQDFSSCSSLQNELFRSQTTTKKNQFSVKHFHIYIQRSCPMSRQPKAVHLKTSFHGDFADLLVNYIFFFIKINFLLLHFYLFTYVGSADKPNFGLLSNEKISKNTLLFLWQFHFKFL